MVRWKVIPSQPAHEASDTGLVRSIRTGKVRKNQPHRTGILMLVFSRKGAEQAKKHVARKIHHLVLEAFVGPCPEGMQCRHLDGNKENNHLSNLAWGTPIENAADKLRHGTSLDGERNHQTRLTTKQVKEIRIRRASGERLRTIAQDYGVSLPTISEIANHNARRRA